MTFPSPYIKKYVFPCHKLHNKCHHHTPNNEKNIFSPPKERVANPIATARNKKKNTCFLHTSPAMNRQS